MSLNIKDPEAHKLAQQLAAETGVTAEYPTATPPPYEIFSSKFSAN